jgi:hypothetical protein
VSKCEIFLRHNAPIFSAPPRASAETDPFDYLAKSWFDLGNATSKKETGDFWEQQRLIQVSVSLSLMGNNNCRIH